jgi:hypothetical protein
VADPIEAMARALVEAEYGDPNVTHWEWVEGEYLERPTWHSRMGEARAAWKLALDVLEQRMIDTDELEIARHEILGE